MASNKVKLQPLGSRILIKPIEEETKTKGGLIIPDTAEKEKPAQGEVVSLGTGKISDEGKKIEFRVKIGDKVLFKKYAPDDIEVDGVKYLVLDEDDVLAIIS